MTTSSPKAPKLPPQEFIDAAPTSLREQLQRYVDAIEAWKAAGKAIDVAASAAATSKREDRRRSAEAVRAGKPDPGEKETAKAKKAEDAARRAYQLAQDVAFLEETELWGSLSAHVEGWKDSLGDTRDQHTFRWEGSLRGAAHHANAAHDAQAAIDWLDRMMAAGKLSWFTPGRPRVRLRGIESNLVDVLEQIIEFGLFHTDTDKERFSLSMAAMRGTR